ncbi:P-loop containing nucleoside triphosphate hydrolase protein [Boletus reticuloceps]|uniref:P-loop containing nucleoside triphosphate hydrolase protein n=1 Tax=Boletus reticuloceps TaxID=495285 RepID=A0A8I3ADQ9_9AGAM|nr:P-loop containing nucleoside triphosphate hydrolase protein [Boletus reticuloceps]
MLHWHFLRRCDACRASLFSLPPHRSFASVIRHETCDTRNIALVAHIGHADFGMEVESASRVVDGAVVLMDSVEGVEAQTMGVWRQLSKYNVATRMLFVNKLDRPGASFRSSLLSLLTHRLHANPLVITLPLASMDPESYSRAEPGIEGLVDLVKWELWKWTEDGSHICQPLPLVKDASELAEIFPTGHPIVPHLVPARTALLENLAMFSEDLMDRLLGFPLDPYSYLRVQPMEIIPHLRKATIKHQILPVLCGSAIKSIGTELVMDYIGHLLASPLDVRLQVESADAPLRLLAWKVAWDKRKGWMTFIRVYSGTLRRQKTIFNVNTGQKEQISKLLLLYASEAEEVDSLPYGSVGVVLGLKYTRTGDTLVDTRDLRKYESSQMSLRGVTAPPAVMSVSVIPNSHSDLDPVQEAVRSLIRTDPSVRMDNQEGQILVHGLGALHLAIIEGRLKDEWGAQFEFGKRQVSYRESTSSSISARLEEWSTQIAGKTTTVKIALSVAPLGEDEQGDPAFDGNLVLDARGQPLKAPDAYSSQLDPFANLARGIASALSSSPHTSLPLSHVRVRITQYILPPHAPPSILTGASSYILCSKLREAGMGPVLEPYINLKVSVYMDALGKVVKDISENGGEVLDLASSSIAVDDDGNPYPSDGLYIPSEESFAFLNFTQDIFIRIYSAATKTNHPRHCSAESNVGLLDKIACVIWRPWYL